MDTQYYHPGPVVLLILNIKKETNGKIQSRMKTKEWCNNFEDWHFNNNFYFTIELNNNKYYIYNHCKTCKIKELIDMSISKLFRFLV